MQRSGSVRIDVRLVTRSTFLSRGIALFCTSVLFHLVFATGSVAQDAVRVGGTGIGLALAGTVGRALHATEPTVAVTVLPSLGTPGGIKALDAGAIDVAIAARPMKASEKATGIREAACLKTALTFATSRSDAPGITLSQLPDIYADPAPRWPDGQPLKIILRSAAGSENPYLAKRVPGMKEALDAAFARTGIPVGATDQENAALAVRTVGSFAIATLLQIRSEKLPLMPLPIDGVAPNAQSIGDGSYPLPIRICFLLPARPTAGSVKFIAFLRSPTGVEILRNHECAPES